MEYTFQLRTHIGKVRSVNEDAVGELKLPNGHVFVVCDGMGGHVGGAIASQLAVDSFLEYFKTHTEESIVSALQIAFQFANEQIYARTIQSPELVGMGTTAVVFVVQGEKCYVGHVGDSRCYVSSDGKLDRLTKDHSFVQQLIDQGIISENEAETHPKKNQISKALGNAPTVEPTLVSEPILLKSGSRILLCSDGLCGLVNDELIHELLELNALENSVDRLIDFALEAGGTDNISACVIQIETSEHVNNVFESKNNRPMKPIQNEDSIDLPPKKMKVTTVIILGVFILLIAAIAIYFLQDSANNEVIP